LKDILSFHQGITQMLVKAFSACADLVAAYVYHLQTLLGGPGLSAFHQGTAYTLAALCFSHDQPSNFGEGFDPYQSGDVHVYKSDHI
jgi:hypothetical protein